MVVGGKHSGVTARGGAGQYKSSGVHRQGSGPSTASVSSMTFVAVLYSPNFSCLFWEKGIMILSSS